MSTRNAILLIIAIGFATYFTSLFNHFVMDDFGMIVNNNVIHSLDNFPKFLWGGVFDRGESERLTDIYYRPILPITFSLTYAAFGTNPFMYHLMKLVLHVVTAIIMFSLLKKFFKPTLSLFLALIFVVHPGISEAVFYITSIADLFIVLFGMAALVLIAEAKSAKTYIYTAVLLSCALFSKETGLFFLPLSLLISWLFNRKSFGRIFAVCAIVLCLYGVCRFLIADMPFLTVRLNPIMRASFEERLYTAPAVLFYYIKALFLPSEIATSQHWIITEPTVANFYIPLIWVSLFFLAVFAYLFFLYKKRSKYFKLYLFFCAWFIMGIGLNSHIIHPLSTTVADRWLYFPIIGLLGMIGVALTMIKIHNQFLRHIGITVAIVCIILLSVRTIIRSYDWQNGYTLGCHDRTVAPPSFELEALCGYELLQRRQFDQAQVHLEKSIALLPYGINLNNLGSLYLMKKDKQRALELYKESATKYRYYKAYENLAGVFLYDKNNLKEAKKVIREGLGLYPSNLKLWYILALTEYRLGNKDNALYSAKIYAQLKRTKNSYNLYYLIQKDTPWEELVK